MNILPEYFQDEKEYPVANDLPETILPYGEYWAYVTSSFINGFLNVGTPIAYSLLNRYVMPDERFDESQEVSLIPKDDFFEWTKFVYTSKMELVEKLQSGWKTYHFKLDMFRDDVLVLNRIGNESDAERTYLFFWLDMDCSDCCIGRFKTTDTEEVVLSRFYRDADTCEHGAITLDKNWFGGWLSF